MDALVNEPHLVILPDRELYALPWAALLDKDGKFLIERHAISVAPSVGTLLEIEQRAAEVAHDHFSQAMVVGNPHFGGRIGIPQLPGAEQEARHIAALFKRCTLLIGKEATKERVVDALKAAKYAHLATHGWADGVMLSGGTEGSMLSMAEVQALQLPRLKLVVLSACDSFKGKLHSDGVWALLVPSLPLARQHCWRRCGRWTMRQQMC
jgi:CHAT domain-containing protein